MRVGIEELAISIRIHRRYARALPVDEIGGYFHLVGRSRFTQYPQERSAVRKH